MSVTVGDDTTYERETKWDMRFLRLAREVASWSRDPSTKVGAVIVRSDKTIASLGYNGFPRGIPDRPEMYANREEKYKYIVHAEANAIVSAREPLLGYTLYTMPLPVCQDCCKLALQAGIMRFVSLAPTPEQYQRWGASLTASDWMIMEAGASSTCYDALV